MSVHRCADPRGERLDSGVEEHGEPDVKAHRLDEVDRLDERDVEAHRFDGLEGHESTD